jgi:hypothetical protein
MAALKTLNSYERTTVAVKVKTESGNEKETGRTDLVQEKDSDLQAEDKSEVEEGQVESNPEDPEREKQDEPATKGKRSVQYIQTNGAYSKRARRYTHSNVHRLIKSQTQCPSPRSSAYAQRNQMTVRRAQEASLMTIQVLDAVIGIYLVIIVN